MNKKIKKDDDQTIDSSSMRFANIYKNYPYLETVAILLVFQLRIPYLKFYLDNAIRFQTRHTTKFQFPFRVFYVLSVFSRPATVLNLDLFTSVTEYGMKSSSKVSVGRLLN